MASRMMPEKRRSFASAVTLPCYEGRFLSKTVEVLEQMTPSVERDFVIVIAEEGSDSSEIVGKLKSQYGNITYAI